MNIGRTIRVFRAEPVLSPIPDAGPRPGSAQPADAPRRVAEVAQEPPAEIDAGQPVLPLRLGG